MNHETQIFKEEPGFLKLFQLFKEKYQSLGRIGGTVNLRTFNEVELESIAGFLGQSKESILKKGSIALLDFEQELSNTNLSGYTLFQLLEEVLGESIITKKEKLNQEQKQEEDFIHSLNQLIPTMAWWFQWIHSKSPDTRWIWSLYKQNKHDVYEKIIMVCKAFISLPTKGEFERLPLFSQRITGNPHDFDNHEVAGKLLIHCMYVDRVLHENMDGAMPKTAEELNELLAEYGIMRDDLWNFVTCRGLLASSQNKIHPVWQAAINCQTVMNIPMRELSKIDRVWPAKGNKVWIIENSSVCSTVMDAVGAAAIVCTHGQLRMASWHLLDLLVQSNCTLYYSGDLDPEGIIIAERLKRKYKDQVVLWRMDKEAYKASLSSEDISNRLSKLKSITSSDWKELIHVMKDIKMAGYQEAIVSKLISDIKQK